MEHLFSTLFRSGLSIWIISMLVPYVGYLFYKAVYGTQKTTNELTAEEKDFLKVNHSKYQKIQNYCTGLLLLLGFILLFNYHTFDLQLPHLLISNDYTGIKVFIVVVFSIAYWSYIVTKIITLVVFGKRKGMVMTEFEYLPHIKKNEGVELSDRIIKHPYDKLFGKKSIIILILSLIILFI